MPERDRLANPLPIERAALDDATHAAAPGAPWAGLLWEASPDALAISDSEGVVLAANPAYFALYGFSPDQVIGRSFAIIFPEAERASAIEQYRAAFLGAALPAPFETCVRRADGAERWVEARVSFFARDGRRTAMLSTIRDISARKQAEAERNRLLIGERAASERLRQVLDVLPEGVVIRDADGRLVLANAVAAALLGPLPPALDLRSDALSALARPDGTPLPTHELPIVRAILDGEAALGQHVLAADLRGRGRAPLLMNAAPLRDGAGRIDGGVAVFQDIAAIRSLERRREERVAGIAHDLKNSLTTVQGRAQMLLRRLARGDAPDPATLATDLERMQAASAGMDEQVAALVDAARLQAGRGLDLRRGPVDLVALAHRVAEDCQAATDRHALLVEAVVQELAGDWDAARLAQALQNLVLNAIKYDPSGREIVVTIGREEDEHTPRAVLAVRDRGVGIPAADLPRLFEPFYRATNAVSWGGNGLGLWGVKEIIEAHGGTVSVQSAEGQGSTFTVRLPLVPTDGGSG